jgi:DHA2 family multidrug resistance protein
MPGAFTSVITMPVFGRLTDKFGPRYFIIIGVILITVSNFMYHNLEINSSYVFILIPMILFGIGMGSLNAPITSTAMNIVKKNQVSMVSTILSVIMQVGGAFSVAILGTILNNRTVFHLAINSENANPYSYQIISAIEKLKFLSAKLGDSIFLQETKAKVMLSNYINKISAVSGYQDAFIWTALFCLVAMIPAILLWNVQVPATTNKNKISAVE